jgi:hypothetical protein
MSSSDRKVSLRNKANSAIERIVKLEGDLKHVVNAVNNTVDQIGVELSRHQATLAALIELAGAEEVESAIERQRVEALEAQAQQTEEMFHSALEQGVLVEAEKIGPESVLMLREFDKEGAPIPPSKMQLSMPKLQQANPEAYGALLGQGVGFTMESPIGGVVEILAIYDISPLGADETDEEADDDGQAQEEASEPPEPPKAPGVVSVE